MKITTNYRNKWIVKKYQVGPITRIFELTETLKFIGEVKGKKVLDLGCGSGEFTALLNQKGATYIGVDLSSTFIDEAKKLHPEVEFLHLDGSDMRGIPSNYFDMIVMRMVLVNIDDVNVFRGIFRESSRALKVGGELIFTIHNPAILTNFKDSIREFIIPQDGNVSQSGMRYKLIMMLADQKTKIIFDCYHWSENDIKNELTKNDFVITETVIPLLAKNSKFSFAQDWYIRPHHKCFRCLKRVL